MLRIKIELVPHGDEENKKDIGEMLIANTLKKGQYDPLSYVYDLYVSADEYTETPSRVGSVEHQQSEGVWMLVQKAITALKQDRFTSGWHKRNATPIQTRLAAKCGETLGSV